MKTSQSQSLSVPHHLVWKKKVKRTVLVMFLMLLTFLSPTLFRCTLFHCTHWSVTFCPLQIPFIDSTLHAYNKDSFHIVACLYSSICKSLWTKASVNLNVKCKIIWAAVLLTVLAEYFSFFLLHDDKLEDKSVMCSGVTA